MKKMDNPAKRRLNAACLVILGIAIGLVPGAIKMDQMRQAAENSEAFHLRSMADLKHQLHDEQMYSMKQMALHRHALGIRLVLPTATDASMGMTCAEEYFGCTVKFWEAYALGCLCAWPIVWFLMWMGWWPSSRRKKDAP
jgi:hypothetical protein